MDVISPSAYQLGEGPRLDGRTGDLLWVDIRAGLLHTGRLHGGMLSELARYEIGDPCGAVAPLVTPGAGWVVAAGRGFRHVTADGTVRRIGAEIAAPGTLMNDGACDPAGRFVAGSQVLPEGTAGTGALYRLGGDRTTTTMVTGVGCSNGVGWSADGTTMFYVDSRARRLDAFDYDPATGAATGRRTLADIIDGSPDGLCVDDEGCVWVAVWDAWCVRRFTADGRLIASLPVPVPRPTAVCLVGTALVVTSAWHGLDAAARARAPLSGHIFAHDVGVTGRPATGWTGDPVLPA